MKRIRKMGRIIYVMLIVVLLLVGCSQGAPTPAESSVQNNVGLRPKSVVIVSGNTGATWYYVAAGQAQILTNHGVVSATTETSSAAPIQNMPFMSNDDTGSTMAMMTLDGLFGGLEGDANYGFDPNNPITNVSWLMGGNTTTMYCLTLDSNIKTVADLRGKKVSIPTMGNSANLLMQDVLKAYDMTIDDFGSYIPMLYSDQGDALKDGVVDAIWVNGGIPMAVVTDLDTTKDIHFVDYAGNGIADKVLETSPQWVSKILPKGTYRNQNDSADTVLMGIHSSLCCHEDLDEELVYQIVKCLIENNDELTAIHPEGRNWNLEMSKMHMDIGVPVHPGAQRYYDEVLK